MNIRFYLKFVLPVLLIAILTIFQGNQTFRGHFNKYIKSHLAENEKEFFAIPKLQIQSLNNVLDFLFPNTVSRLFAHLFSSFILA